MHLSQIRCLTRPEKHTEARETPLDLGKKEVSDPFGLAPLGRHIPQRDGMKLVTVLTVHPGVHSQESGGGQWAEQT